MCCGPPHPRAPPSRGSSLRRRSRRSPGRPSCSTPAHPCPTRASPLRSPAGVKGGGGGVSSAAAVHGADKRALSCGKHPQAPVRSEAASPAASRSGRERGPIYGMELCLLLCVDGGICARWRGCNACGVNGASSKPRSSRDPASYRAQAQSRDLPISLHISPYLPISPPCVISSTSSES